MKKITSLLFFIRKIQKNKISSALEEKLMQKLEKKKPWRKIEEVESSLNVSPKLSVCPRLAYYSGLAHEKTHNKAPMHALLKSTR